MEAEVVEALRLMRLSAEAHEQAHKEPDQDSPFCIDTRTHLVAALMIELGLDIEDIGFIASAYLEIQCDMEAPETEEPPAEEEWPGTIGG